jgi:hypothetical protein
MRGIAEKGTSSKIQVFKALSIPLVSRTA